MSRDRMPILICDFEDGCDEVTTDFWEQCASTVNGVRVTMTERSPGWVTTVHGDFCPIHANGSPE